MIENTNIVQGDLNESRSFCSHELSAVLDSQGGLCELSYIDVHEQDGVLYPDEKSLPIIVRDSAEYLQRPLYGPAIFLYTLTEDNREILHYPAEHTISPWSLRGADEEQSYAFMLDRNRIFWNVTCNAHNAKEVFWCLQQSTLFCGEKRVHMQQHTGTGSTQSGGLYSEEMLNKALLKGSLNGKAKVVWEEDSFDKNEKVLYIKGTVNYPFGTKYFYFAIGCNADVYYREFSGMKALCAGWKNMPDITVVMAMGSTKAEALSSMRDGVKNYSQILENKRCNAIKIQQESLQIDVEKLPKAIDFSQMAPQYLEEMMVGETQEGYIGVCAAVHKFGYFSLWDAIYPIRDLLWNGRLEDAARQITYLLKLPMMDNTPIASLHAIVQWNEALAFCPEMGLEELYPEALKMFWLANTATEPKYHMLKYTANVGVDRPQELGLSGEFLAPDVNALWYMACRVLKNEAFKRNDKKTFDAASEIVSGIEKGYEKVFFDSDVGYLRAAVNTDFSLPKFTVFQNTNTWGYDYPYGMYLMRNIVKPLANYQAKQLWHPTGHKAVTFDSTVPCEMWRQVHMNQHNGHEMKLQRMAGNMAEVYRVMGQYLKRFDRWKVAEETTNFSRFCIHPAQVCSWQAFSATANLEALRCAVSGVVKHRGGIGYLTAPDDGKIQLRNIPNGNSKASVTVSGEGTYAVIKLDGEVLEGTLQIPADKSFSKIEIERTERIANDIMLVAALDMPINKIHTGKGFLSFSCGATAATPICLICKSFPEIYKNGEKITADWDSYTKKLWIDECWNDGDEVIVQLLDEN